MIALALVAMLFSDVRPDYWAYDAIRLVAADGLMDGLPGGVFGGERPLTQAELEALLTRLQVRFTAQLGDTASRADLARVRDGVTALGSATSALGARVARLEGALAWRAAPLRACAVLEGYPGGALDGNRAVTRAEMATIAARLITRMDAVAAHTASKHDLDGARALVAVAQQRLDVLQRRVARLDGLTDLALGFASDERPVNRNAAGMAGTITEMRLDAATAQLATKDELDGLQKAAIAISAELDALGVRVTRLEEAHAPAPRT